MDSIAPPRPAHPGDMIRLWRTRRRLSQLDLAMEAEISSRHLSFLETGRARPSRDMALHLAETLDMPLRERNVLLNLAGFAPAYGERRLDHPALAAARAAVAQVLAAHAPYPALAVDRHWVLQSANSAVPALLTGVDPALLQGKVNVLRLSLHPGGLAPRIANLAEWRGHLLARLRQQVDVSGDAVLAALLEELAQYQPKLRTPHADHATDQAAFVVPLRLRVADGELAMFSTTTVFGTPVDVTLAEIALESFFPADAASAALLRRMAESG